MDEAAMNQAFSALRDQFGDRLVGDQIGGEVKMRQAVMARLNVDESQADLMVKQLAHTGWVRFHSAGGADEDRGGALGLGGNPAIATTVTDGEAGQPQAWTEDRQPIPMGSPQMDQGLMVEPMIAASMQPGMAQGTSAGNQPGAIGGAMVAAAASNLGNDARGGEADDPTLNQDMVNSEAADENPPDPRGYWQISGPPSANVTAASGGGI